MFGLSNYPSSGASAGILHIKLPGLKQLAIFDESHRSIIQERHQGGFHYVRTAFEPVHAGRLVQDETARRSMGKVSLHRVRPELNVEAMTASFRRAHATVAARSEAAAL